MALVHSSDVYVWKEPVFGKPSFKPYRLKLLGNGRLSWQRVDDARSKGQARLAEIFRHVTVGALTDENRKERATDDGLILAYHTLIVPLEHVKTPPTAHWRRVEFAFGFERQFEEWLRVFARLLSVDQLFDDLLHRQRRRRHQLRVSGSNYGLPVPPHASLAMLTAAEPPPVAVVGSYEAVDDDDDFDDGAGDTARLWSASHGANADHAKVWTTLQNECRRRGLIAAGDDEPDHHQPAACALCCRND